MASKIGLITMEPDNPSNKKLIAAARKFSYELSILYTTDFELNFDNNQIYYRGQPCPSFDLIIPRIGPFITRWGIQLVRQFELNGTKSLNASSTIALSRNKAAAYQALSNHQIPIPKTLHINSPKLPGHISDQMGDYPLILKRVNASKGEGVSLAQSQQEAEQIIDQWHDIETGFLAQEYIKETGGVDIRMFVVGKHVVAAMKRQASPSEFRSNIHQGGKGVPVKVTNKEKRLAIKAARIMGLNVAGVDILRSARGPLILEVNSSPGLRGIEQTSGIDVASEIFAFMEQYLFAIKSIKKK